MAAGEHSFLRGTCEHAIDIWADAPGTPASDEAFAITELLEAILDYLPGKDVLVAQRVSKSWQATIQNSIKLHKALWFARNNLAPISSSGQRVGFHEMKQPWPTFEMSAAQFFEASSEANAFFIHPELEFLLDKKPNSDLFFAPELERFDSEGNGAPAWMREISVTQPPSSRVTVGWQCQHTLEDLGEDFLEEIPCLPIETERFGVTIADLWRVLLCLAKDTNCTRSFCFKA